MEQKAIYEFEKIINEKIGKDVFRDLFNKYKYGKEWDLLFQAQHAGIKTTITDWTDSIETALYFATEKSKDANIEIFNCQIWCYMVPKEKILHQINLVLFMI